MKPAAPDSQRAPTTADAGSLLLTLWAAVVLCVVVVPLWMVLRFVRDERRAYRLVRVSARVVVAMMGYHVHVTGLQHLRAGGPSMFVANHASESDAVFLLAAMPAEFRFIANHLAAAYPILGLAIRKASYFIVNRDSWRGRAECGRAMVGALAAGQSLLVFPEGRTGAGGRLLDFRNGAFRAAARSGRSLVPIAITGTARILPPSSTRLSRGRVRIEILTPIDIQGDTREAVMAARDLASQRIAASLGRSAAEGPLSGDPGASGSAR